MCYRIAGIGEILWDVFPNYKKLGGAPANFAYFIKKLGQYGVIASRIGHDPLGKEILGSLTGLGLDMDFIQVDLKHPTGTVDVKIDGSGQPDYIINENVAWDFLKLSHSWKELAGKTDVVCFGTLAQRSSESRKTITSFLKMVPDTAFKVLDLNLRQNFYSLKIILRSLELSTVLKLSKEELEILKHLMGSLIEENDVDFCRGLMKRYGIRLVCITRGDGGSLVLNEKNYYDHPGYKVSVADTVGAGDAFTAAMVIQYLRGGTLEEISNSANKLGAWVCSKFGPTPVPDGGIENFLNKGSDF